MKTLWAACLGVVLCGCVNNYASHYRQLAPDDASIPSALNPTIKQVTNADEASKELCRDGSYLAVGESEFSSSDAQSDSQIIAQAKKVGADLVVCDSSYLTTKTGVTPVTSYTPPNAPPIQTDVSSSAGIRNENIYPTSPTSGSVSTQNVPYRRTVTQYHAVFLRRVH